MSISVSAVLAAQFPNDTGIIIQDGVIIYWNVPSHPAMPTQTEIDTWTTAYNVAITAAYADELAARNYAKLTALKTMTPTQIQSWIATNVVDLATAKDAILTLAIGVGILARKI